MFRHLRVLLDRLNLMAKFRLVSQFRPPFRQDRLRLNLRAKFRHRVGKCRTNEILLADASQYLGGEFLCWILLWGIVGDFIRITT